MEILRTTTRVSLGDDIKGTVVATMISGYDHVQYKVVYWNSGTLCKEWFEEYQVEQVCDTLPLRLEGL